MTFSANVVAENSKKLNYRWTVSDGTITGGQGTPSIIVRTTREQNNTRMFATVEIEGLSAECPKTHTSEVAEVFSHGDPPVIAVAESFVWSKIRLELDGASTEFQRYPKHYFYIISYVPRGGEKTVLTSQRRQLIKNYLMSRHRVAESQLVFVFGGESSRFSLRVYRVPEAPPIN
jgi:hypothetical protein